MILSNINPEKIVKTGQFKKKIPWGLGKENLINREGYYSDGTHEEKYYITLKGVLTLI